MSNQTSSQSPQKGQIESLRRIVEQLRLNLYSLEEQAALYGPLDTPIHVRNAIAETTGLLEQKEAELARLQLHQGDVELENSALKKFWKPFVNEGADISVPHEDIDTASAGTRVKVTALTMQGVFNLYRLLVEQFVDTLNTDRIRLDLAGTIKTDTNLERLAPSTFPHLIVIGAPGAHPLANYFMHQFKGLSLGNKNNIVRRGYVFRVSGEYLGSPFIISDATLRRYPPEEQEAMQQLGIYDLMPGQTPKYFPRNFEQYGVPGFKDQDCAIIVTGWASLPGQNQIRRVVIIAGHSRHSTLFGTAFVATNEEWAQQVNALKYHNTETIIGLDPDPSGEAVAPSILAPPREIYKQMPNT